jgi:hypothetical protein
MVSSHSGLPFFSPEGQNWLESKTGERAKFEKFCAFGPPWQRHRHFYLDSALSSDLTHSQPSGNLPDRALVENYLAVYRTSIIRLVFPFLDPVLFQETLTMAYEPSQGIKLYSISNAKASVLAFLSLVSALNLDEENPLLMDAQACAVQSQLFSPQLAREWTFDDLQTSLMLVSSPPCCSLFAIL